MIIGALTTLIFHSILSKAWQGFWGSKCGCFHKRAQLLGYQFCLCIALRAGTARGQIEGYLRVILAGIVEKFVLCVQPCVPVPPVLLTPSSAVMLGRFRGGEGNSAVPGNEACGE